MLPENIFLKVASYQLNCDRLMFSYQLVLYILSNEKLDCLQANVGIVKTTKSLTETAFSFWITNCIGWYEPNSLNASLLLKKNNNKRANDLWNKPTKVSSYVIFYCLKILHWGFWKITDKYFLLPVLCFWDKVKQLKYLLFMQNIPVDLH